MFPTVLLQSSRDQKHNKCVLISARLQKLEYISCFASFLPRTRHSLSSSSSSSGGGLADGISWISRRLCSVDCSVPSWCCCWLSQPDVKPPSSWDGLEGLGGETAADRSKANEVRGGGCWVRAQGTGPAHSTYLPPVPPAGGASAPPAPLTSFSWACRRRPC